MQKVVIIGNWKMNKSQSQAREFFSHFNELYEEHKNQISENISFGIAPSFTSLGVLKNVNTKGFILGAQNAFCAKSGAFTGEISVAMLKELGVSHVIVGHSERREIFQESDELVNKKVHFLMQNNMVPIFCCGENLAQHEANLTEKTIEEQIKKGLANVTNWSKIIIAYEPIWAIGTGKTASAEDAQKVCALIRKRTSPDVIIQYGGSVKPENIASLVSQKDINGALVGGASLEAKDFLKLLVNSSKVRQDDK